MAQIEDALQTGQRRIVFVSGAPGAGKTLVGLKLAFSAQLREQAVFVTGNAPLVDVLCHALQGSYKRASRRAGISGYAKEQARHVRATPLSRSSERTTTWATAAAISTPPKSAA
ncbi:MAG: DUF2075 domain-containing protein [Myxococcales bacterium]|nr:DUF2075 domain-containing protein [Myxococcales bacterium]